MRSQNLRRKHESLPKMSRHRIRINNDRLKSQLYKSGMKGTHSVRRDDGIIWLYLDRTNGNYQLVKDRIREYELENCVEYELLLNPKGFNPKYDWVWVVPKHETFYREGDEKYEGDIPSKKVGIQ